MKKGKVNRSEFLNRVAKACNKKPAEIREIHDQLVEELLQIVTSGQELTITGLGNFRIIMHKGHPAHFLPGDQGEHVDDYPVLKFAPANILSKRLRKVRDA